MTRILDTILSLPWAIREESLEAMIEIASRENQLSPEAVQALLGRPLENSHSVTIRDGVATIPIEGPIVRYASFFTAVSGGTSIETVAQDLTATLANPDIHAIVLTIDSPGGEVNGVAELSDLIYEARGSKPIIAYASNQACSAAYWIATAADKIVVAPTAMLGSIGVVATFGKLTPEEKARRIEFVSSQSPKKRPNLDTKEGRGQIQSMVDALADVFVERVARNRSVTIDTVLEEFGAGGVFIGQTVVDAGMADEVGSYEHTIASLLSSKPRHDNVESSERATGAMNMGDKWERFKALFDDEGEPEARVDPTPIPEPAPAPAVPAPVAGGSSVPTDEIARLRAENQRLQMAAFAAQASEFASGHIAAQRAFPAEKGSIEAFYIQAAMDDMVLGSIDTAGKTRLGMLAALYDNRPVNQLTLESLTPQIKELIQQRVDPPASSSDKDKPATPDQLDNLLSRTSVGTAVLQERSVNGTVSSR
jgi:signal peptide peptidase SppA